MSFTKKSTTIFIIIISIIGISIFASYIFSKNKVYDLKVAVGKKGKASELLVKELDSLFKKNDIPIRLTPAFTNGSLDNAKVVQSGEVDLGVSTLNAAKGEKLKTVAFLFPQINHLVTRDDPSINSLADLKGKKIATSQIGGGTYVALLSLLDYYGLALEDIEVKNMSSSKFAEVFANGSVDAVFYNDYPGSKKVMKTIKAGNGKLLPLEDFKSLNMSDPFLETYNIPVGLYSPANPKIPLQDMPTVGYQTALVVNSSVDDFAIKTIVSYLFDYQSILRDKMPLISFLKKPEGDFFGPPLHPGAIKYYSDEKVDFLEKYEDEIKLLVACLPILVSLWIAIKSKLQTKYISRISDYHQEVQRSLLKLLETKTVSGAKEIERELHHILSNFIQDQNQGKIDKSEEGRFSFAWEKSMQLTKEKITEIEQKDK